MATGTPGFGIGAVDVRDVAAAHVAAGFEATAQGCYVVSDTDFAEMAAVLRQHCGDAFPFPKRVLPSWLVWLVGPLINSPLLRRPVARNANIAFCADDGTSVCELVMRYRPMEDAFVAILQQMIEQHPVTGRA